MAGKPKLPMAADFFGGGPNEKAKRPKRKAVKPQNGKSNREAPPTPVPTEARPPRTIEAGFTEKVTFYLPPDLLKRLELTRVQLLLDQDLKVSRSQVVEVILEQMMGDTGQIATLLEERAGT